MFSCTVQLYFQGLPLDREDILPFAFHSLEAVLPLVEDPPLSYLPRNHSCTVEVGFSLVSSRLLLLGDILSYAVHSLEVVLSLVKDPPLSYLPRNHTYTVEVGILVVGSHILLLEDILP